MRLGGALLVLVLFWVAMTPEARARPAADIPLLAATLKGDLDTVKRLLADGTNSDIHDSYRNTALIYAARDGMTEIVGVLLKAGADPGWIDGELVTPLILAAFKGHPAIVKLLLARDADRAHRDRWGRSALDYALRRGADDPIAVLLRTPRPPRG